MDKGKKAWRKLESLKRLHDERERREKGELRSENSLERLGFPPQDKVIA